MIYPKPVENIDDLPKRYGGIERERFWQQYWMDSGIYNYDPSTPREDAYTIDTPPPTVSGALHIGHVFSYTQTDFSARFFRMMGKHVFYPFGFDDNGLPSERLVERITGKRAHEVGREEFIKLCEPILADAEQEFKDLWQSVALSCDWSQFYTTIDARSRAISQASFIDLYNKGYIYRKEAPTQWCWADQTAIAQAEIEDRETQGKFHDIVFKWAAAPGGEVQGELIIATTRPELIPACVAVMVPADERGKALYEPLRDSRGKPFRDYDGKLVYYSDLVGKVAITPLFEVEVPILPSTKADPEKGTGILMCCTFGDQEDVEHWREFNLPDRTIISAQGRIIQRGNFFVKAGEDTPLYGRIDIDLDLEGKYSAKKQNALAMNYPSRNPEQATKFAEEMTDKKVNAAQGWIRNQLAEAGLLTKVEDITHTVRYSERGGVKIEIMVTPQWYINLLDRKETLIEQGKKVKWHPTYMFKRFEHWVEGLNQDWCISRQRYNGVPFPVWYAGREPIVACPADLPVNPLVASPSPEAIELFKKGLDEKTKENLIGLAQGFDTDLDGLLANHLVPEADVMDTWATSSLTPLLNTHLQIGVDDPETQSRHDKIFPYDLRPQAHDIIRTWAFYTIAKSYFHFGEIPWKDIVISGHAQDAKKKKISKSKGHVVTPAEMVEKYTADNLRYWSSSCKLGTDTIYDEKNLTEGKRLINKLFNATKFALRHLMDFTPPAGSREASSRVGEKGSPLPIAEDGLAQSAAPTPQPGSGGVPAAGLLDMVTYPTDKWMLGQLNKAIEKATKANKDYEFGDAKQAAEDFFWTDLCDNYLELSKGRLYSDELAAAGHPNEDLSQLRQSAQAALYIALSSVLKLFAPIMPHITEECWSWYFAQHTNKRSIHEEPWPTAGVAFADEDTQAGELLVQVIAVVRKWKSEHNVSLKVPVERLTVYVDKGSNGPAVAEMLAAVKGDLLSASNARGCCVAGSAPPEDAAKIEGNPYCVVCELADVEEG